MLSLADGASVVKETIFSDRFRYVDELRRMGADIKVEQDTAIVRGVSRAHRVRRSTSPICGRGRRWSSPLWRPTARPRLTGPKS